MRTKPNVSSTLLLPLLVLGPLASGQSGDPDLNNDGVVNVLDLSLVSSCFSQAVPTTPEIEVATPEDGSSVKTSPITVSGSVSETAETVTVNGVAVSLSGAEFTTRVNLSDGVNAITIAATTTMDRCIAADVDADGYVDHADMAFVTEALGQDGFPQDGPPSDFRSATKALEVTLDSVAPTVAAPEDITVSATEPDGRRVDMDRFCGISFSEQNP